MVGRSHTKVLAVGSKVDFHQFLSLDAGGLVLVGSSVCIAHPFVVQVDYRCRAGYSELSWRDPSLLA